MKIYEYKISGDYSIPDYNKCKRYEVTKEMYNIKEIFFVDMFYSGIVFLRADNHEFEYNEFYNVREVYFYRGSRFYSLNELTDIEVNKVVNCLKEFTDGCNK